MPGEKGSEVLCGGEMIYGRRVKAEFLENIRAGLEKEGQEQVTRGKVQVV